MADMDPTAETGAIGKDTAVRRYLVVANQTLAGDELVHHIEERAKAETSEFYIVVPATPILEMALDMTAMPYIGGIPMIPTSPQQSRALAEERLSAALAQLQEVGAAVDGRVCDPDPVRAVQAIVNERQFDEIIVSTLPSRISRWLRQDLPHRLEQKCGLPVTHVEGN